MFTSGSTIAIRGHRLGKLRTTKAVIVVDDGPDAVSYWWPAGMYHVVTEAMLTPRQSMLPETTRELERGEWDLTTVAWHDTDVLATTEFGSWVVVWHMWDHTTGDFLRWYVDLKRPHRRTDVGFDTYDLDLDLVIEPDGRWAWKDRDEFDARRAAGLIHDDEAREVERSGAEMVSRIEAGRPPFDGSQLAWRPDARWEHPVLDASWSSVPLA